MNLKPLNNHVIVEPVEEEKVTKSGIVLPDTGEKKRPTQGKVVAVGPGKMNEDGDGRIPMSVKPGDIVLFEKYGPDEVEIDGKEYLVVEEDKIIAVVE